MRALLSDISEHGNGSISAITVHLGIPFIHALMDLPSGVLMVDEMGQEFVFECPIPVIIVYAQYCLITPPVALVVGEKLEAHRFPKSMKFISDSGPIFPKRGNN
jgi:hypothetical protein